MSVYLSVPTLDEGAWRETEPHTPSPRARLEAVRKLNEAGVPAGILIAPLMPGHQRRPRAGRGDRAHSRRTRARSASAPWRCTCAARCATSSSTGCAQHRPDLIPRYEQIYERGAYAAAEERKRLQALVRSSRRRPPRPSRSAPARTMKAAREQTSRPPQRERRARSRRACSSPARRQRRRPACPAALRRCRTATAPSLLGRPAARGTRRRSAPAGGRAGTSRCRTGPCRAIVFCPKRSSGSQPVPGSARYFGRCAASSR